MTLKTPSLRPPPPPCAVLGVIVTASPFFYRADLPRNTFYIGVEFPEVRYTGQYSMNIPTPMMRVTGAGNVRGNASEYAAATPSARHDRHASPRASDPINGLLVR